MFTFKGCFELTVANVQIAVGDLKSLVWTPVKPYSSVF